MIIFKDTRAFKRATGGGEDVRALGRLKDGVMNRLEAEYSRLLETRRLAGEVAWFAFEVFKIKLAKNTFYTPDFLVMLTSGEMEVHEVKGFWQDDARAKFKIAADKLPFQFIAIRKDRAGWVFEKL